MILTTLWIFFNGFVRLKNINYAYVFFALACPTIDLLESYPYEWQKLKNETLVVKVQHINNK